jgi:hypothetical protein
MLREAMRRVVALIEHGSRCRSFDIECRNPRDAVEIGVGQKLSFCHNGDLARAALIGGAGLMKSSYGRELLRDDARSTYRLDWFR